MCIKIQWLQVLDHYTALFYKGYYDNKICKIFLNKLNIFMQRILLIGLLLSHFWLLSCLSYTSYILPIYILSIHFTYHQFYILLQPSHSLFEEPSSHRCRGRCNLGSDLRIWGRRWYNPEGYNRRHRSICELPCCWITLTTLHVIHHITYHRIYHYYAYTHIHIAAPIANPQPR